MDIEKFNSLDYPAKVMWLYRNVPGAAPKMGTKFPYLRRIS